MVRAELLDDAGHSQFVISQSDFREISGYSFPFRVEYQEGDGQVLATEFIDDIVVTVADDEIDVRSVTH